MPQAPTPPIKDIVITSDDPELIEILKEIKQTLDIREGRLGDTNFRFIDYYELLELLSGDETITITVLPGAHNHPHNDLSAIQGGDLAAGEFYHLNIHVYDFLYAIDDGYLRIGSTGTPSGALEVYQSPGELFFLIDDDNALHIEPQRADIGFSGGSRLLIDWTADIIDFRIGVSTAGRFTTSGFRLSNAQFVDTIETVLTDDDSHLATSGAVFDAIAAAVHDKIAEGDSSVEVIDAGTGQVDTTVDSALVLRALVDRLQIPIGLIESNTGTPTDLEIDCGTQKTLKLTEGVWKDINVGGAILNPIPAFAPDLDQFKDEGGTDTGIYTYAFGINESASGSFEIQHDYKYLTDISMHIHWQGIAAPTGTDYVKWELTYCITRDGETLDAATVIVAPDTPIDTQYDVLRSTFPVINGTTGGNNGGQIQLGDQFLFTIRRIAATGDAYAGDALVCTAGLHYQVDTLGSRQIGVK